MQIHFHNVSKHTNTCKQTHNTHTYTYTHTSTPPPPPPTADPQPILAMPTLGTGADGNEPTYDTANVTWAHPGGTVDQFVVQYRVDMGGARRVFEPWVGAYEVTVNGTQLYALLTELTAATDYEAQVASRNTNGQSEFSPPIKFTTARKPCL